MPDIEDEIIKHYHQNYKHIETSKGETLAGLARLSIYNKCDPKELFSKITKINEEIFPDSLYPTTPICKEFDATYYCMYHGFWSNTEFNDRLQDLLKTDIKKFDAHITAIYFTHPFHAHRMIRGMLHVLMDNLKHVDHPFITKMEKIWTVDYKLYRPNERY